MSNSSSRRDFMKSGSFWLAGASLAGGLNLSRTAHAAGNDELKIALIGCGGRGKGAVLNCVNSNENVKVVAVADAFENNARSAYETFQKEIPSKNAVTPETIFHGFDAYKKVIASGADLILMATPPGFRPIHYAAAVEAGKHVFMEKPCCVDAPGYRSLLETNKLAKSKNLKVGVGLQRHHHSGYVSSVKRIQDGELGDIQFYRAYWNGGPIWIRKRQSNQTEMEYQMRNWYHFVWLCGDHILEQHVHNIDVCNWIENDHPVLAQGMGSCQVRNNQGIGQIYDNHFVEFTYKSGRKLFSQCRQQSNCWSSVSEWVHGSDKSSRVERGRATTNPYDQEHIELVDAIRNNKPFFEGDFGATSSFTGVLGRMATYSGREIAWDEAVANGKSIMPETFAFDADPPVKPDDKGNYPMAVPGVYDPFAG